MASYDGSAIFGRSVKIAVGQLPGDFQRTAFQGQNGVYSLFGGSRGRTFNVEAVLYGADLAGVLSARAVIESYHDGIARVLVDTTGYAWGQVVYNGDFTPGGQYTTGHGGVIQPYRCSFMGMV